MLPQSLDQAVHIVVKVGICADRYAMSVGEILDALGEVILGGHVGATHQHWNQGDVPLERRFDLDADEVSLILDSGTTGDGGPL